MLTAEAFFPDAATFYIGPFFVTVWMLVLIGSERKESITAYRCSIAVFIKQLVGFLPDLCELIFV